jgi:hypothetical protein
MSNTTTANNPTAVSAQIIRPDVLSDGSVRFNVPLHSQDIRSVEAVDLDLVFTA